MGSWAAGKIDEQGAKKVAVYEVRGGILKETGREVQKIMEHLKETGSVVDMPGTRPVDNAELLTLDVDILIPAALGGSINKNNVEQIKARLLIEAANSPVTPEADEALQSRGVIVVPDILVNAGGVTVSYFEWVQNLQQVHWDLDHVNRELEKHMTKAWQQVHAGHCQSKLPLRISAYCVALDKLAETTRQRY